MNQVVNVELENNPQYGVVVSSRRVAEGLGKKHYNVVRDLDQILENSNLSSLKNCDIKANIIPATYTVANQKRKYREYLLTKDGFTLYMFNIQGYNDFKWAYIQKFNEMEAALANVSKPVQQRLHRLDWQLLLHRLTPTEVVIHQCTLHIPRKVIG